MSLGDFEFWMRRLRFDGNWEIIFRLGTMRMSGKVAENWICQKGREV
jgi:hypothetical protein